VSEDDYLGKVQNIDVLFDGGFNIQKVKCNPDLRQATIGVSKSLTMMLRSVTYLRRIFVAHPSITRLEGKLNTVITTIIAALFSIQQCRRESTACSISHGTES
jgi:hypothetical protein